MGDVHVDWNQLSPQAQLEIAEILRKEGLAQPAEERKIPGQQFRVVSGPATNMVDLPNGMRMARPRTLPRSQWGRLPNLKDPR